MNIYKVQKSILNKIISEIKNNQLLSYNIINAALLGSFQTKEAIKDYSDLDILFILKSNRFGEINLDIVLELKQLLKKIKNYGIEISFLIHTVFDLEKYVDTNYLIHYSWGDVFYGDKKQFVNFFKKNIKTKNFNEKKRKKLVKYNISHSRFNLLRKYISWNDFSENGLKKLIKLYIDGSIEICDWALIYKNIFLRNKREILKRFFIEYKDWGNVKLLNDILIVRSKLMNSKINKNKADAFIQKIIPLINYCNKKVYE